MLEKSKLKKTLEFFGFGDAVEETSTDKEIGYKESKDTKSHTFYSIPRVASALKEIVILEPQAFDDVKQVADHIRLSQVVVLNLQGLDGDLSRRIIDFSSGVIYSVDGSLHRVTDEIFILAPVNIEIIKPTRRNAADFISKIEAEERIR